MGYGNYPDLNRVNRALVVKLRHLGDALLAGPVFSILKKRLPNIQIDACVYEEAAPILEGHPAISGILKVDRGWKKLGLLGRLAKEALFLRDVRRRSYDLVINLTEGDRGAMITRVSGASIRVGVDARKVYTHVAKSCPSLRHKVERDLDAVRRIGIFPAEDERELFFEVSGVEDKAGKGFVLIHPTSRWRFKCWPEAKMRRLAERLLEKGEQLIFTSGPDRLEREMVDRIVEGLPICNLAGEVSLKELGSLIERAKVLVCVDSLPFHLASALKRPVVALFGPTSEVTWGPWRNPRARVVMETMSCRPCYMDGCGGSKKSDCLEAISVERVLLELELLSEIKSPGLDIVHDLVDRA